MKNRNPEEEKIYGFLLEAGLDHLFERLLSNGFDELDIVLEVDREHLTYMELSMEDQASLLRAIALHKNSRNSQYLCGVFWLIFIKAVLML